MLRTRISHAVAGAAAPRVSTIPGVPEATPKLQVPVAPGCWPLLGHAPAFLAWQHFQRGGGGGDFAAALRAFRTATGSPTFAFVAPGWSREHIVVTADAALSQQFLLHQGQFPVREYDHVWAPIFERRGWTSNAVVWAHGESWKRLRHVMNNTLAQLTRMEPYFGPIEDASRRFAERYLPNHLAPPTEAAVKPNVPAAERDDANAGGFAVRGDLQDLFSATFVEAMIPTLFGLRVEPLVGSISASPQQQRSTIRVTPASGSSDFAIDVPTDHFARLRRAVMATLELTQRVQAKRWIAQRNPFDADYAALCSMFDDIYACLCTLWDPLVAFYQRHGRWPAGVDAAIIAKLYAQVENRELSEPEAVWVLGFALAAGGDTTAQSFENVLHALAVSPSAQHKLANEIAIMSQQHRDNISYAVVAEESPYLRATIKESLRLCPVIAAHLRVTTKDFSYSSSRYAAPIVIPTGSKVVIDYGAIARDPLAVVGPQPSLAFAPDRFLRSEPAALQHTTGGSSRNRGCPRRQEADEDANTAYAADTSVQAVAAGAGRCPYHHHPAATLAFGHGPRKCPGGGFATLLLLCLTRDVVARYELQSTHRVGHSDRIPLHSRRGPMRPTEPVAGKLRFIPRAPQPEHK